MADLRGDDRGQIILVAAFLLAITFVVLALVVNSAIFTENLATRDDVAGSHDALDHRSEVQATVGTLLMGVNNDSTLDETDLEDNIEAMSEEGGLQQSSLGRLVSVSYVNEEDGTLVAQDNSSRNFTSADETKENWNVTDEGDFDIRSFQMNVTTDSDLLGELFDNPFRVIANETSSNDEWSMEVDYDSSLFQDGGLEVEVHHPDGVSETCTREVNDDTDYVLIDVTGATVAGESCSALNRLQNDGTPMWFGSGIDGDYRIEFEHADEIKGTYSLIGDGDMSTFGSDTDDAPVERNAIYSVTVGYEYYTSAVGYETEIRVAPGEVPP